MSEINGSNFSVNSMNLQGVHKVPNEVPAENSGEVAEESTPKLTDFSDSRAEALGRSMLFKGSDSLNHDLKVLLENPQIAENSDKMFETSYQAAINAGIENPYEEAASASTTSV